MSKVMRIRTLLLLSTCAASLSLQAETQDEGIRDTTEMMRPKLAIYLSLLQALAMRG